MAQPIGEIIEVTTTSFTAQCLEDPRPAEPRIYDPPAFGSFVKIQAHRPAVAPASSDSPSAEEADPFAAIPRLVREPALSPNAAFALVCHARTSSLTPGRRPVALGFADENEMRIHQPQIFELLTTEFSGMLVAYTGTDGRVRRHLPPIPPRIHSWVTPCTNEEIEVLTRDLAFLRTVLMPGGPCEAPPEQLVAACLRAAWDVRGEDEDFLLQAGRTLLILLGDDYDRLQAIMNSVII